MRKKVKILCLILTVITVGSTICSAALARTKEKEETKITFAASFYPIYLIAKNLTKGIEGVEVLSLAANQTGCLHDYQITTSDMKLLYEADALLLSGGGMESFVEQIAKEIPNLPMLYSDEEMIFLDATSEHHHGEKEEEIYNSHIWMDPERYKRQIENLANKMGKIDERNKDLYLKNARNYQKEIEKEMTKYKEIFQNIEPENVIIFHDAFAYLSEWLPISVVHTVNLDENTALSANEIKEVIEEIREFDVKYLLVEKQNQSLIAEEIAKETGAKICVLNALVTGKGEEDEYLLGLQENLKQLEACLIGEEK